MSNALLAAIAGLVASTTNGINQFVPKFSFRQGTFSRRTRIAGTPGQAGDKVARHAEELRLGLRHGVSYPMRVTPRMARAAKKRENKAKLVTGLIDRMATKVASS